METKAKPQSHALQSPSLLGGFFQGAKSGVVNSSLMMGIFYTVGTLALSLTPMGWSAAGAAILATGLFSGVLGAKKVYDVSHAPAPHHGSPVRSPARSQSHAIQQDMDISDSPSTLRTDWAERTGRSASKNQNHAQQVLESRESETGTSASRF